MAAVTTTCPACSVSMATTNVATIPIQPINIQNLNGPCFPVIRRAASVLHHQDPLLYLHSHSVSVFQIPSVAPLRVVPKAPATPAAIHRPAESLRVGPQLLVATNTEANTADRITPATTEVIAVVSAVAPIRVPSPRAPTVLTSSISGFRGAAAVITVRVIPSDYNMTTDDSQPESEENEEQSDSEEGSNDEGSDDGESDGGENDQDGDEAEDEDEEGGEGEEGGDGNANAGWAEAMAKILGKKTPETKSIILVKNKELDKMKEKEKKELLERKKQVEKKRAWENLSREKPDLVKDRENERAMQRIATRGVVQLFNAVRKHQKTIDTKVKEVGGSERKKAKLLSSVSKKDFIDVLRRTDGGSGSAAAEEKPAWSVLTDDFMMGATMKDWDKDSEGEEADTNQGAGGEDSDSD
ncbi:hypothetical protein F7725_018972 [Dissostichus mawsoni]|uniref:RRP15-like protein n=1 Tax=Dissostichus mawsoni TaxID=36200 RepID=A0A7J5XT09_DISMA|nr:hypothetical protein F7725_018972 [Dissostichus mawsoni]